MQSRLLAFKAALVGVVLVTGCRETQPKLAPRFFDTPPSPPGARADYSTGKSPLSLNVVTIPQQTVPEVPYDCRPVHYIKVPSGWAWNTNEHIALLSTTNMTTWVTNVVAPCDGMLRYYRETNHNTMMIFRSKVVP